MSLGLTSSSSLGSSATGSSERRVSLVILEDTGAVQWACASSISKGKTYSALTASGSRTPTEWEICTGDAEPRFRSKSRPAISAPLSHLVSQRWIALRCRFGTKVYYLACRKGRMVIRPSFVFSECAHRLHYFPEVGYILLYKPPGATVDEGGESSDDSDGGSELSERRTVVASVSYETYFGRKGTTKIRRTQSPEESLLVSDDDYTSVVRVVEADRCALVFGAQKRDVPSTDDFATQLRHGGYRVHCLLGRGECTRAAWRRWLDNFNRSHLAQRVENIVVLLAGHGNIDQDGHNLFVDAKAGYGVAVEDVVQQIQRAAIGARVLAVLDACGGYPEKNKIPLMPAADALAYKGVADCLIIAPSPGEILNWKRGRSVLTSHLIDILAEASDRGANLVPTFSIVVELNRRMLEADKKQLWSLLLGSAPEVVYV